LHWTSYVPAALLLLAALICFIVGASISDSRLPVAIGVIFFLASAVTAAAAHIKRISSEFAITNRRVLIKVGLLGRHTLELLLQKVEGIGVDQPLSGRLFGFGSIVVTGTGGTRERFDRIADPLEFRRQVQIQAELSTAPPGAPPAPAFPPPTTQSLPGPFCTQCGAQNPAGARL